MRDIFEDIFSVNPLDPMESARRNMRPDLRRRFYEAAAVEQGEGGFLVRLDGRPVRTPARRELAAPVREIAQGMAQEWNAQRDVIDPARMPLTRLANSIVDGVQTQTRAVADEIARYLGSDLLFYRAGEPEGLVAEQERHWSPLLDWARERLGARFVLAQGVIHAAQPPEALAAARRAIPDEPWALGAMLSVTALTGSALLALALAGRAVDADAAWAAAHVDEDWNMRTWGRDAIALERRAARHAEMQAAATVLRFMPQAGEAPDARS